MNNPDWIEPDPFDFALERRFLAISEREGRVLRVVCAENDDMIRVVTAFIDRDAKEAGMTVKLHYDPQTDAAYLRFSSARVSESTEVATGVVLDYDADGRIVGMEVLDARAHLPADALVAAE